MTTIDRRVVDMGFNNKQFEDGVQTSVKSLDNLKKGLNFDDASKSLINLGHAGKTFSLDGITNGIGNLTQGFSAFGVVAFTVIQNLTNSLIGFGQKWINTLAIQPLTTGLREYETQINAIQTIMANTSTKGTTLEQVNAALDQLNEYSDKTIYNFTEMARNIGTFTAAGVDLDTSVSAIKGISNLAAVSGSSSQQAAMGMYQLSQALASGTVRLMDWNSVNSAGMGGEIFKNSLIETARVHGVKIDEILKKEGSFRESLQTGWLTTEVLTETLAKFTGDLSEEQLKSMGYTDEQIVGIIKLGKLANDSATKVKTFSQLTGTLQESLVSGWSLTWRTLIGDFEEAKLLYTEINDTLGVFILASSKARNDLLQGWKDLGGRQNLIVALRNSFDAIVNVIRIVRQAFLEVFPPATAEQLADLTWSLYLFTRSLKMGGETADKLHSIFKGVASIFSIAYMAVSALVEGFFNLGKAIVPKDMGILEFFANIGDYLSGLRTAIEEGDIFGETVGKIVSFLTNAIVAIKEFGDKVGSVFEGITNWSSGLLKNVDTSGVKDFVDKLEFRFSPLSGIAQFVTKAFSIIMTIGKAISPFFFNLATIVGNLFVGLANAVSKAVTTLNFENLFDAINGGLIASLILAMKSFVDKGSKAFSGITGILDGVRGSLEAFQSNLQAKTIMTIAIAIGILAISIIALSLVDSEKLTKALTAITVMFGQLVASMALLNQIPGGKGLTTAPVMLLLLSASLLVLSAAVATIASIDPDKLVNGLLGIQALMISLVAFASAMSKNSSNMIRASIGFVIFGLALQVFANVIERIGEIDVARLQNGLVGVGVILTELALFMQVTDLSGMGISKGLGILGLAAALLVLSIAVKKFGDMDPEGMRQGLLAVGIVLSSIGVFVTLTGDSKRVISTAIGLTIIASSMLIFAEAISKLGKMSWDEIGRGLAVMSGGLLLMVAAIRAMPKNMIVTSVGLVIVASAMLILSKALTTFGDMTWDEIARGLVAIAGALTILSIAMYVMSGSLSGAAAMFVVSGALILMATALKMIGSMKPEEIVRSLLAIAGVFAILGLAGLVLAPLIPTLFALSGTLLLFGLACAAVGVGVLAFSAGLAALAISGTAGAAAIVVIIQMLLGLLPMLVQTLVNAIILFATLITEAAPAIGAALTATLLSLIKVIADVTPPLLVALKDLLLNLIAMLVETVPPFVEAVLFLITSILQALAASLPAIIQAAYDILLALLKGIEDNIGEVVTTAMGIVTAFLNGVADGLPDLIDAGFNMIVAFLDGIADGIEDHMQDILDAGGRIATAIVDGLVDGLVGGAKSAASAMVDLGSAALNALKTFLGIKSPSKATTKLGKYTSQGFIDGLVDMAKNVGTAAKELGRTAIDGMSSAISRISESLSTDIDMAPTIRPVVDMAEIIAGGKLVDKTFGEKTLNVSATTSKLAPIISSTSKNTPGETLDKTKQNPTVSFTQYNYSPESLSAYDIYRQTRNQLEQLKGLATS